MAVRSSRSGRTATRAIATATIAAGIGSNSWTCTRAQPPSSKPAATAQPR
jgi:hypothetical protein